MKPSPSRSPGSAWLRLGPEMLLALAASLILLGFLGSPELWGKREQRAAAEALDTVEHGRWLVAQIQGRPRLEKPPLPRWTAAALLSLSGERSESLVRLPNALAGLATVGLVYLLGKGIGGRSLALTSAAALVTTGLFISEQRQAGNDGMLGLFTTLALSAAWRRLNETPRPSGRDRGLLLGAALGLGFLCKGPIILMVVAVTLVPYLACTGRLKSHGKRLLAPRAWLVFLGLAACWPVAVLAHDPNALGVWLTEMGQKTGMLPIGHREREVLGLMFPALALPWSVLAVAGLILPAVARRREDLPWPRSELWFPWWWVVGNLAIFSAWAVAKPHYLMPCLPGLALLVGMAWLRLCAAARDATRARAARLARGVQGLQGLLLLSSGLILPLIGRQQFDSVPLPLLVVVGGLVTGGTVAGAWLWRLGRDALAPLPIAVACALGVLLSYGLVAPLDDPLRGHAGLASVLDQLVPAKGHPLRFFHEIDEGLWFYLRRHPLEPISGSQPRYSDSYDRIGSRVGPRLAWDAAEPIRTSALDPRTHSLRRWLRHEGPDEEFLLLRASLYDRLVAELEGMAVPVYREEGLKRNPLVLLRILPGRLAATSPDGSPPAAIRP